MAPHIVCLTIPQAITARINIRNPMLRTASGSPSVIPFLSISYVKTAQPTVAKADISSSSCDPISLNRYRFVIPNMRLIDLSISIYLLLLHGLLVMATIPLVNIRLTICPSKAASKIRGLNGHRLDHLLAWMGRFMGNWFRPLPADAMESDLFRRFLNFFSWIHVFDLKADEGVNEGY